MNFFFLFLKFKRYDKNNISETILKKLRIIVSRPEFDPELIGLSSLACKSLALWCKAIDNYAKINKTVAPKKEKLNEMTAMLDKKNNELQHKLDLLNKVRDSVNTLQNEYKSTVLKKEQIMKDITTTNKRIENAGKLNSLLEIEGLKNIFLNDII